MAVPKSTGFGLVQELIEQMAINDSSLAALADDLKGHSVLHVSWLTHVKSARDMLVQAENSYNELVATLVSSYAKTEAVAAKVANYAKYDVPITAEVKIAHDKVGYYKNLVTFFEDIARVVSKRGDMLIALTKLDQDAVISTLKSGQANYIDMRQQRLRWARMQEYMDSGTWSQGPL